MYYSSQIGIRIAGTHTYKITVTDANGNTSSYAGTFAVVAAAGPSISSVVVAEAAGPRNGIFQSDEPLVVTWAATSPLRIVSQTLTIDGTLIAPIAGPYSGMFYSCPIGTWAAGSHRYVITSTDSQGNESSVNGTFSVVQAPVVAPTIADVVVAEASTPKNGILDSSDSLLITWAATSPNHVAAVSLQVDGSMIAPIGGPYGGRFYLAQIGKYGVGSHNYKITATDSKGVSSSTSGTFVVVAPAAPTIANVVVAEAGTTKDGVFEANEPLLITWSATSPYHIVSQVLSIDGTRITPISGPFGGQYYYCQIGGWPAGRPHLQNHSDRFARRFLDRQRHDQSSSSPGTLQFVGDGGTFNIGGTLAATTAGTTTIKLGMLSLGQGSLVIDGNAGTTSGSVTSGCVVYTGGTIGTNTPVNVATLTLAGSATGGEMAIPLDSPTLTLTGSTSVVQVNGTLCLDNLTNVALIEDGTSSNGIPEVNEPLAVTWSLPNDNTYPVQSVTVDGRGIAPIAGDGNGNGNYRCDIGGFAAGQHTITISVDHGNGSEVLTATFTVPAALTVDAATAATGTAGLLTDVQLAPIVAAAEARWTAPGSSQVAGALTGIDFKVANLAPGILVEKWQNTIWIDDDAAGYGWFVDPTPGDDAEFAAVAGTSSLSAPAGTAADQRADLLTAVMHEIGNVLGNSDTSADDLMNAMLPLGTRRLPDNPV